MKFFGQGRIVLSKDVDKDNNECPLKCKAMWTGLLNPETGEVVEAKIYLPEDPVRKVLIICPGYRGDFVLQEQGYADAFCKDGRAIICLRHNGLRVVGDDVTNYVHCPERQKRLGKYTGQRRFSVKESNREVLTAIEALPSIENLQVDIIGHSWGAQIALESLKALKASGSSVGKSVRNVILLGATVDGRPETYKAYRDYFASDAEQDFFREMDPDEIINDFIDNARDMSNFSSNDIPENVRRVVLINSLGDGEVNIKEEQLPFYSRIKDRANILILPTNPVTITLGGRESEEHDYFGSEVRGWIEKILAGEKIEKII